MWFVRLSGCPKHPKMFSRWCLLLREAPLIPHLHFRGPNIPEVDYGDLWAQIGFSIFFGKKNTKLTPALSWLFKGVLHRLAKLGGGFRSKSPPGSEIHFPLWPITRFCFWIVEMKHWPSAVIFGIPKSSSSHRDVGSGSSERWNTEHRKLRFPVINQWAY